jgi:hypothetical protein
MCVGKRACTLTCLRHVLLYVGHMSRNSHVQIIDVMMTRSHKVRSGTRSSKRI